MEDLVRDELPREVKLEINKYMHDLEGAEKYSELPEARINPFVNELVGKMEIKKDLMGNKRGIGTIDLVDKSTGEVLSPLYENRLFYRKKVVDKTKFVKIYLERFRMIFDLSLTAIRIYGYILDRMQQPDNINRDMIYIDVKEAMEFCKYKSKNQIYSGILELIKNKFIAKSTRPGLFYVDASVAFNGNRLLIMDEIVKEGLDDDADHFNGRKALK